MTQHSPGRQTIKLKIGSKRSSGLAKHGGEHSDGKCLTWPEDDKEGQEKAWEPLREEAGKIFPRIKELRAKTFAGILARAQSVLIENPDGDDYYSDCVELLIRDLIEFGGLKVHPKQKMWMEEEASAADCVAMISQP